jgi:hypothetical protein
LCHRAIPTPTTDPKQPNTGTYHDVLTTYGPLIKNSDSSTLLALNLNLTPEEGDKLIKEGKIDVASYGRPWINNPDFEHVSNRVWWSRTRSIGREFMASRSIFLRVTPIILPSLLELVYISSL